MKLRYPQQDAKSLRRLPKLRVLTLVYVDSERCLEGTEEGAGQFGGGPGRLRNSHRLETLAVKTQIQMGSVVEDRANKKPSLTYRSLQGMQVAVVHIYCNKGKKDRISSWETVESQFSDTCDASPMSVPGLLFSGYASTSV